MSGHSRAGRFGIPPGPAGGDDGTRRAFDEMLVEALDRGPGLMARTAVRRGRIGPRRVTTRATGRNRNAGGGLGLPAAGHLDRQRRLPTRLIRIRVKGHGNRAGTPGSGHGGRDRAWGCRPAGRHPVILSQTCTSVTQPAVESSGCLSRTDAPGAVMSGRFHLFRASRATFRVIGARASPRPPTKHGPPNVPTSGHCGANSDTTRTTHAGYGHTYDGHRRRRPPAPADGRGCPSGRRSAAARVAATTTA